MASAAQRVLSVGELLELILLNLTLPDLLHLQLVNKHWYQAITSSTSLEVNMFYKLLSPGGEVVRLSNTDSNDAETADHDNTKAFFDIPTMQLQKHPCSPIPLLGSAILGTCVSYFDKETASMKTIKGLVFSVRAVDIERLTQIVRLGGSVVWRKAFLTQPPTDEVTIMLYRSGVPFTCDRESIVKVKNDNGVTFGDLFDKLNGTINPGEGGGAKRGRLGKLWKRIWTYFH